MLLELSDILELSGFIIIKDNELNTIKKPTKTITILNSIKLVIFYNNKTA
jgi:hypothetical protein